MPYYIDLSQITIDQYRSALMESYLPPSRMVLKENLQDRFTYLKSIGIGKGDLLALGQPVGFGLSFLRIEHYVEKYKDVENRVLTIAAAQCPASGEVSRRCQSRWSHRQLRTGRSHADIRPGSDGPFR